MVTASSCGPPPSFPTCGVFISSSCQKTWSKRNNNKHSQQECRQASLLCQSVPRRMEDSDWVEWSFFSLLGWKMTVKNKVTGKDMLYVYNFVLNGFIPERLCLSPVWWPPLRQIQSVRSRKKGYGNCYQLVFLCSSCDLLLRVRFHCWCCLHTLARIYKLSKFLPITWLSLII